MQPLLQEASYGLHNALSATSAATDMVTHAKIELNRFTDYQLGAPKSPSLY